MTGNIQLLAPNANRVLFVVPTMPSQVAILPGLPISGDTGIIIPPNSASFVVKFADWGGIVGYQWYALSGGVGALTITVTEVIYYPEGA